MKPPPSPHQGPTKASLGLLMPPYASFVLLLGAALFLALYSLLRYGGLWGETDTKVFTTVSHAMLDAGALVPVGPVYPNGYGYQTLVVFILHVTGMSLSTLQLYGSALLIVWLIFPAWLAYREYTNSNHGAALATIILFVQPEFLFAVLRGTHEKFTRGLMLLCLYLLLRSLRSQDRSSRFAGFVLAFYLAGYALITFNNLLATSFIVGVGLALLLSAVVIVRSGFSFPSLNLALRRLVYAVIILVTLSVLFTFYAYQPAEHNLLVLQSIWQRLAALFLDLEHVELNPYSAVNAGWINLPVYFMVSLANWLLLASSAMIWLWQSMRWYRQEPEDESQLLLWAFYGAFALIGALSIAIDLSGALSSNLQHRLFPSFAMLAAPLVARWLTEWKPQSLLTARLAHTALWVSVGLLAILSTLKATNEPLLSNKWLFYLPAEMESLNWGEEVMHRKLWLGYDERLSVADGIRREASPRNMELDQEIADLDTRHFLISDVIRELSLRLSQPLPVEADSFVIFDNGQAQIYHLRPRTPYQE